MPRQISPMKEIEDLVRALPVDAGFKTFAQTIAKTDLEYLGVRLPDLQQLVRDGFSFYSKTDKEILAIWDRIWQSTNIHEVMTLPLLYYRWKSAHLTPAHVHVFKKWFNRIENWAHADQLCQLLSILYERYPTLVEPTLKQWNRSKNPWKRRASIVSTIYYASPRRTPPSRKVVLSLIEPLLQDKDPYVQKGVGWQLREAYNLWPKQTLVYLEKHILDLPTIVFSYSTEKLNKKNKTRLKEERRKSRRS